MREDQKNFDFEFQSKLGDIGALEDNLKDEAETRLTKLAHKHTDVTGASIIVEPADSTNQRAFAFRARVVAYTRPNYIAGTSEAESAMSALKGALDAVERQVREERDRLRETWKQNRPDDIPGLEMNPDDDEFEDRSQNQ